MIIKLNVPDKAKIGDVISALFPDMDFRENRKGIMSNYFMDIQVKKETWEENYNAN